LSISDCKIDSPDQAIGNPSTINQQSISNQSAINQQSISNLQSEI